MQKVVFDGSPRDGFIKVLTHRIEDYFRDNQICKKPNGLYVVKIVLSFLVPLSVCPAILSAPFEGWRLALLFVIFGVFMTTLLFSVAHDGSRQAISKRPWINQLFAYVWNLGGISSYFWELKHNIAHQRYFIRKDMDFIQFSGGIPVPARIWTTGLLPKAYKMKTLLLLKDIYREAFRNLGNYITRIFFKGFAWFNFALFIVVLYAFIFRVVTGFPFD